MIRSKEIMRNKMPAKEEPRMMKHIEVHPKMGGGVHVMHHFTSGKPETHEFGATEGPEFADHMMEHAGMSWDDHGENVNQINKEGVGA